MRKRRTLRFEHLEDRRVLDGEGWPTKILHYSADEFQDYMQDRAIEHDRFGSSVWTPGQYTDIPTGLPAGSELTNESSTFANRTAALSFARNTFGAGYAEAVIAETDGEYLYLTDSFDQLTIIDVRDPIEMTVVGKSNIGFRPAAVYVSGDRLALVSGNRSFYNNNSSAYAGGWLPYIPEMSHTMVAVYDVSDKSRPELISTSIMDGNPVESHFVNDQIYLVTSEQLSFPTPNAYCKLTDDEGTVTYSYIDYSTSGLPGRDIVDSCRYETQEEYVGRVSTGLLEYVLPSITTIMADGTTSTFSMVAPDSVWIDEYEFADWGPSEIVTTVVFNITDTPGVNSSASVLTEVVSDLYITPDHIYITGSDNGFTDATSIYQFTVGDDGESVELTASRIIPGRLVSPSAMDEFEGRLRITTSSGFSTEVLSGVYVLESQGESLNVVGSATGIAPGQSIRAVRFWEDQAFLGTFGQLLAIDLSDPANPVVAGQENVAGFLEYLQPVGGNYLVGIGNDGDFETVGEAVPQVWLFDVSDLSAPELVDHHSVDFHDWLWSKTFSDLTLSYFADVGILAIPFENSRFDVPAYPPVESQSLEAGLWLFQIDPTGEGPMELIGTVSHDQPVRRSIRIGDTYFALSQNMVTAHRLTQPEQSIGELYFGPVAMHDNLTVAIDDGAVILDVLKNDRVSDSARIIAVTETGAGAHVEISEDGRSLRYTPSDDAKLFQGYYPPDVEGWTGADPKTSTGWSYGFDGFTYIIDTGTGYTDSANVNVDLTGPMNADEMAALAKLNLAERLSISPEEIEVFRVVPVVWSDTRLGVYGQSDAWAEALTPGFVIWLAANHERFDYHTDTGSGVILNEEHDLAEEGLLQPDHIFVDVDSVNLDLNVLANDFHGVVFIRPPEITSVSAPSDGGTVTIAEGGGSLIYTPARGFEGEATFQYTVDGVESAEVTIFVYGTSDDSPVDDMFSVDQGTVDNKLDVLANDFPYVTFTWAPEITSVTAPSDGGTVRIAEGGRYLLYTPRVGFSGRESFRYTVDHDESADVVVYVPPGTDMGTSGGAAVGVRLAITYVEVNPLTQLELGQEFLLRVYVQYIRTNPSGVFSMYLDVEFDNRLVDVTGGLIPTEIYSNSVSGEVSEGLINELGAFSKSISRLDGSEYLLISVSFTATHVGALEFATNPADDVPLHSTGVYDRDDIVNDRYIQLDTISMDVVNTWHNVRLATDVNNDQFTTPMDALTLMNGINRHGVGSMRAINAVAQHGETSATQSAAQYYYDVNNDGYLTAMDSLNVINFLNAESNRGSEGEVGSLWFLESDSRESLYGMGPIYIPADGSDSLLMADDVPDSASDTESDGDENVYRVWIARASEPANTCDGTEKADRQLESLLNDLFDDIGDTAATDCLFAEL